MGLFKRIASILGFSRDEAHDGNDGDDSDEEDDRVGRDEGQRRHAAAVAATATRRGFSVQVPVAVERPHQAPLLVPCDSGEGGVQGFKWYGKQLRVDEDGDVADEFLDEVVQEEVITGAEDNRAFPRFKVKYSTRPAAVRNQVIAADGNVRHSVEHRGRLQWV